MGGFLHFLDFNHAGRSRKTAKHKRHTDGAETPRNSVDIHPEISLSYSHDYESIPFSYQIKKHPDAIASNINTSSSTSPMKLNDEEIPKLENSSHSAPSVIARLMGMNTLPLEAKSSLKGKRSEIQRKDIPRKALPDTQCGQTQIAKPLKQKREETSPCNDNDSTKLNQEIRSARPRPREHPQEEILQKFKKEFMAWQVNKVWEHTQQAVGLDNNLQSERAKVKVARRNPKKENMINNSNASWSLSSEPATHNSRTILDAGARRFSSCHEGSASNQCQSDQKESTSCGNRTRSIDSGHSLVTTSAEENDTSSSPTRIVVLKPGSENNDDIEEIWPSSAANVQREVSMDDFLAEVREKLRREVHGKSGTITTRGSVADVYAKETISGPKQVSQNIIKKILESATADMGATLIRSDSNGSCNSEIQHSQTGSPEFISRETRKFLTERLRNTSKNEDDACVPRITSAMKRASVPATEGIKSRPHKGSMKIEKTVSREDNKNSVERKTGYVRQKEEPHMASSTEVSPRNLVRSLSAPISGTAFGKLILEDQNLITGAHIKAKQEVSDSYSVNVRKNRKDSLNLKESVSNLKHNLTLKGRVSGKRVHLGEKTGSGESGPSEVVETVPPVDMNLGIKHTRPENPTEVPPSPASVSSGSHDELCKPGYPSPVSPLEVPFIEEKRSLHISEEISCNIFDANTSDTNVMEGSNELEINTNIFEDEIIDVDGHEEAYVRDLLVTSGLYESDSDCNAFLSWEKLSQPLGKWVFKEVEETFSSKYEKVDDVLSLSNHEEAGVDRKMLFDLVNEALPYIIKPFINSVGLKRCPFAASMLHGKKLFEDVWNQMQNLTHLPEDEQDCSLEDMAANDVRKAPWLATVLEDYSGVGEEVGMLILGQLIEDLVLELYYD